MTHYWLMKSEPKVYPWEQLVKDKRTGWNGVRNYQANNNMKAMQLGDKAFFYHSNEGLAIVGIMQIARLWYPDPEDATGKFGMVDVSPVKPFKKPVTLTDIKAHAALDTMAMLKQGRLSVSPVTPAEWKIISELGGVSA